VGDENGDGYDDLLVTHDPFTTSPFPQHSNINQVELFFGGNPMDYRPGFIFHIAGENYGIGDNVGYIGHPVWGKNPYFTINNYQWTTGNEPNIKHLSFYEGGAALDNDPEYVLNRPVEQAIYPNLKPHRCCPFDFNGDGLDDYAVTERIRDNSRILMYYGGAEFDTIPDWEAPLPSTHAYSYRTSYSTGYDINQDGYDDLLVEHQRMGAHDLYYTNISLFLGGLPADTVPLFTWNDSTYSQRYRTELHGFSLVPDINGDGYDDWAIAYDMTGDDGVFIYYGGENPDSIYDSNLMGHSGILMGEEPDVAGGDFNGDGYGDIVTGNEGAYYWEGEVDIYFGRPGWELKKVADLAIDGVQRYGKDFECFGQYVGAVGDYNGDGIDDFVVRVGSGDTYESPKLIILAGNPGWKVDVPAEIVPEKYELALKAYPNPFNSTVTFTYTLPTPGTVMLSLYDLNGRKVAEMGRHPASAGQYQTDWNSNGIAGGVYWAMLLFQSGGESHTVSQKIVLLK